METVANALSAAMFIAMAFSAVTCVLWYVWKANDDKARRMSEVEELMKAESRNYERFVLEERAREGANTMAYIKEKPKTERPIVVPKGQIPIVYPNGREGFWYEAEHILTDLHPLAADPNAVVRKNETGKRRRCENCGAPNKISLCKYCGTW